MSHPVIEGPVEILKIVTPGAYWLKCDACEGSSRVPISIRNKPHPSEYYYPLQGDKVFVRDDDGFFYRGTVCGRRASPSPDYWKYVVQLTDTFQVKDFDQDNVFPSYGESSASCRSAHLVSLYHVLPRKPPSSYGKCVKIDSSERKAFENSVVNWDQSVASMAHLTKGNLKFSFVQCKYLSGSIYGNISISPGLRVQTGDECQDLSDYLHLEKLAVRMTFRFDTVVKALMTNCLINPTELLKTFDPFAKAAFKPKPASFEKPPGPVELDFKGFKVHPDDVELHESLAKEFHVNIIYTGAPAKLDRIVRYVNPDGHVVLGTVLNLDIKYAEEVETPLFSDFMGFRVNRSHLNIETDDEWQEIYYPDKMFEYLPPDSESDNVRNSLLTYNFDEARRNFQAAGGIFQEHLFPYSYSSGVEELIVGDFDLLGVESLYDWQKLCLPTYLCRKNLLVIGSASTGKMTMSTISALSWMRHVNSESDSGSLHPQLVIFFSDFERADKSASLCAQLTGFRVVVSTSSFISERQKVMAKSGCDVLITTPSNWCELVSQKVFDYSRLSHVIFDEFERLQEIYTEDIVHIFAVLGTLKSRRLQTVLLANSWNALIGNEMIQKNIEFPTVCIMDVVLACSYFQLTPTVVFVKHNNWRKQLAAVICETSAGKQPKKAILLCKDTEEGRLIIDNFPSNPPALFAHSNLNKDAAIEMLKEWDGCSNKILVCTDDCLLRFGFMDKADIMISWMTSCWNTLSNRFTAFSKSHGFMGGLSSSAAYLFVDCEKLEELLLIKRISYSVCFMNGRLHEHLSKASMQAEHCKMSSICPSLFMFGKCNDFPTCPLRHVFLPDDDLKVMSVRQFLNVDILQVHSAFRYSVRVREVVSNYDLKAAENACALISKLEEIEDGLVKSFRKPFSCNALKVGQMVGACIPREGDPVLRRVTVKSIPENDLSGFYCLSMVDFIEPDVRLPLPQLFPLAENVANYPKDVVDLYITGLMPSNLKSDWQNDTYNFVTAALNKINESNLLAGEVELVIASRSVLVDSLYCYRNSGPFQKTMVSIIGSEFYSLKDLLLESGYCVKNTSHITSLSKLLPESATLSNGTSSGPTFSTLLKGRFGYRKELPSHPIFGVVSSFDDPGLLYVQLEDESEALADFEAVLSSNLDCSAQKLHLIAVNELCAVHYKGVWNRAVIFDIIGDASNPLGAIHILFVDYGEVLLTAQSEDLFCLPEDSVNVPFFAMQCELVGIMPLHGGEWHAETIEGLASCVRTTDNNMATFAIEFHGTKESDLSSICKYLVTLCDPRDPELSVNLHLVRRGMARFDPQTKHMLKLSRRSEVEIN